MCPTRCELLCELRAGWGWGGVLGRLGPRTKHGLTFHLLLAKFFLICSLTDW